MIFDKFQILKLISVNNTKYSKMMENRTIRSTFIPTSSSTMTGRMFQYLKLTRHSSKRAQCSEQRIELKRIAFIKAKNVYTSFIRHLFMCRNVNLRLVLFFFSFIIIFLLYVKRCENLHTNALHRTNV